MSRWRKEMRGYKSHTRLRERVCGARVSRALLRALTKWHVALHCLAALGGRADSSRPTKCLVGRNLRYARSCAKVAWALFLTNDTCDKSRDAQFNWLRRRRLLFIRAARERR